jgi:hypothetical protein
MVGGGGALDATTTLVPTPPEPRRRLHADFLANERDYLRMRDDLLSRFRGQWVAIHGGRVVASGPDLMAAIESAGAGGSHPLVARVGAEDLPFRLRRVEFGYAG